MSVNLLAVETSTDACSVALSLNGQIFEKFAIIPRQHTHNILVMLDALLVESGVSFSQIDALAFGCGPGSFTGLRIAASVIQGLAVAWDRPVVPISTLLALAQGGYRGLVSCKSHKPSPPAPLPQAGEGRIKSPSTDAGEGRIKSPSSDAGGGRIKSTSSDKSERAESSFFSCLDARMGEVYGGFYQFSEEIQQMTPYSSEFLVAPAQVDFPEGIQWAGVGSGCKAYLNLFEQQKGFFWQEAVGDIYPCAYDIAMLAVPRFQQGQFVSAEMALPVYFREGVQ